MTADSPLVTGFDYVLGCTSEFESTVTFMRDLLGLEVTEQGLARNDPRFLRYAVIPLADGNTLEIVEPAVEFLDGKQILCLKVPDVNATRAELVRRGAALIGEPVDDGRGLAWIYLEAPGNAIYQLYGPTTHPKSDSGSAE